MPTTPPTDLAVFAPPKSASTFLGTLLKAVSVDLELCRIQESRWRCATSLSVGCAPRFGGRKRCSHARKQGGQRSCVWQAQAAATLRLPPALCDIVAPRSTSSLLDEPASLPPSATAGAQPSVGYLQDGSAQSEASRDAARLWLAQGGPAAWLASQPTGSNASTISSTAAVGMHSAGVVRGPLRQAPEDVAGWAAGATAPGRRLLLLLHTRHPIEAMVSHYFCVSDARVCPRRALLKGGSGGGGGGNGTTETRPSASADEYFALEMAREASRQHAWGRASAGRPRREPPAETSDLWLLLRRYEEQCSLLNALKARASSSLVVTPSKYEDMVTDFPAWLDTVLLRQLRLDAAVEKRVRRKLRTRFAGAFVPDGKHKHSLRVGTNLARLAPTTQSALRAQPRVAAVMRCLGYHDYGTREVVERGS